MKRLVKKGIDMFSFGKIAEMNQIERHFALVHERGLKKHLHWSAISTRQILISDYWFAVVKHFFTLMLLPLIFSVAYTRAFNISFLIVVLSFLLIVFCSLYIPLYRQTYTLHYLPLLEAVTAGYQKEQQQTIINQLREELAEQQQKAATHLQKLQEEERQKREAYQKKLIEREKQLANMEQLMALEDECRKTQLNTFTLVLIFHTIHKALLNSNLKSDTETTTLLNQLFGRSIGSLREPIEIINGVSSKRAKVVDRKASEIRNRFDEARAFFKAINYSAAIETLLNLEERIFKTPPSKEKP